MTRPLATAIDRAIGVFSPNRMASRVQARLRARAHEAQAVLLSGYAGAESSRARRGWSPGGGSADSDILPDLPTLRERSRDLVRNNPLAASIVNRLVSNVIGHGIKPQSRIDASAIGITPLEADEYQRKAEQIWERWANEADTCGRLSIYELQAQIERQTYENGESLILLRRDSDPSRFNPVSLEIVESDRIGGGYTGKQAKNIIAGVELGPNGEPIAYHVLKSHPGDPYRASLNAGLARIPRFDDQSGRVNAIHHYQVDRPGQTRGVPLLAPVLNQFKDLGDFMETELIAARAAACFSVFIKTISPDGGPVAFTGETTASGNAVEYLEPGIIQRLGLNEEIQAFNPNRPSASFAPFVQFNLKIISAAVGLPYEIVALDFGGMNYSVSRTALVETRRMYRHRQAWNARKIYQPIWEMVLEEAYLAGEFDVPDFYSFKDAWCKAAWIGQGYEWVDPEKEINAAISEINGNIGTVSDVIASRGRDWEEVFRQRAREIRLAEELGLMPYPQAGQPYQPQQPADPNQTKEIDPYARDVEGEAPPAVGASRNGTHGVRF